METPTSAPGDWLTSIRRYGVASWSALGIMGFAVACAVALGAVSTVMVPLVIAVIVGTLLRPVADALERRGVPAVLATVAAVLVLAVVAVGTVMLVVRGFLDQIPEISSQLAVGWSSLVEWGRSLELDAVWLEQARAALQGYAPGVGGGVLGMVRGTFLGAIALALGTFFSVFFLFFVLRDGHRFPGWVAAVTKSDPALAEEVAALSRGALSGYFRGVAITAAITSPIFVVPLLLLGVPLVVPIFIMYFFLSFVPFVGAWITGVFAVLIAFGSGGPTTALIVLASLLVSNGSIQTAVSSWALGSSLKMHPVAVLIATMVGGAVAGILGMVLAPPLLSAATKAAAAIAAHRAAAAAGTTPLVPLPDTT